MILWRDLHPESLEQVEQVEQVEQMDKWASMTPMVHCPTLCFIPQHIQAIFKKIHTKECGSVI